MSRKNDDDFLSNEIDAEEEQRYLAGLAQSFDHTEFQSNVRQILCLRRHALEHSGPTKEEYYQSLVDAYKTQQEQEAKDQQQAQREKFLQAELEKAMQKSSIKNPNQQQTQLDYDAKKIKLQMLMNKNNIQAAQARQRIKDEFGEDYSSAGRALLHGERLPETAKFSGCTVTSTGSRGTLWARTLKQWRRDKANESQQTEDSRASEAMATVDAKVRIEQMKSRMSGDEVQAWAAEAINQQLSEKTRSAVGRIQSVIDAAKKIEKRRLRRDYLKEHPEEAETFNAKKNTTYRQQQEAEIFRLANAGGDFTKNMSPELHGLWLRSLLPGQKLGGMSGQSGYSDDEVSDDEISDDKNEEDEDDDGLAKFDENGKRIKKETKKQRKEREGISVNEQLFTSFMESSTKTGEKNHDQKQVLFLPDTAKSQLHRQKVDPKLLDKESIRERARQVLFGGVTTVSTMSSDDSEVEEEIQQQEPEEQRQQLSRKASSIFSVSSAKDKINNNNNNKSNNNNNNSVVNTPALSNVSGIDNVREENLFSPDREQLVQEVTSSNNNNKNNNTKISPPESCARSSKTPSYMHTSSEEDEDDEKEMLFDTTTTSSVEYLRAKRLDQMLKNKKKSAALLNRTRKKKSYLEQRQEDFEEVVGGVNVTLEKTAKDAHTKVLRLLDAETHGNIDQEEKNRQFSRMQDLAARRKYLNATKHWGDSRYALIWNFELDKIKEEVSLGRHHRKHPAETTANRRGESSEASSAVGFNQEGSPVSNSSTSTSSNASPQNNNNNYTRRDSSSPSVASTSNSSDFFLNNNNHDQGKMQIKPKSDRIQKIHETIELLEQGKIGNVIQKKKFHCRLERNANVAPNDVANSMMGMSVASVTSVLFNNETTSTTIPDKSVAASKIMNRMNSMAFQRTGSTLYGPAAEVLASSPKSQHQHHSTQQQQQQHLSNNQQPSASSQQQNNNNNNEFGGALQQQKQIAIPALDAPYGKYQCALDIKLDHFDPQTGKPVALRETNMPEPDLFAYQRYAREKNMIIIIRPVSQVVPQLYATPGLHIKGKSINVSLKSSSYRPIDGLIPVNPALGKAYLDAMKMERAIEDMMSNATGGVVTVSLLKRLRAQKAAAGSLTQAFRRDIINSLDRSEKELELLMEKYRAELIVNFDKERVSKNYIERFNEAQFLGTTHAKYKEKGIFYRDDPTTGIERDSREAPVFYIESSPKQFFKYNPDLDVLEEAAENPEQLFSVMVVTHRMFAISETTHRIEPDPTLYMIGPDFDGLAYATRVELNVNAKDRIAWALKINDYRLNRTMGLVNEFDIEHVREVRELTEWKQNHGYECGNTVKTQPVSLAAHAVITPESFSTLHNVYEIVSYMRTAWGHNIPLIVNPNWRVVLDGAMLPRLYGDELSLALPVVDDCGASAVQTRFEVEATDTTYERAKKEVGTMESRFDAEVERRRTRTRGGAGGGGGGVGKGSGATTSGNNNSNNNNNNEETEGSLEDAVKLVVDKKALSELFFHVRRWQMMPPIFVPSKTKQEMLDKLKRNVPLPLDVLENQTKQIQKPKYGSSRDLGRDLIHEEKDETSPSPTNSQEALRAKFFSIGSQFDGRTKWNAPIEDPVIDQEFERFRNERVVDYLKKYEQGKEYFLFLHTEKSSQAFVANMDDYLFPDKYIKA